MQLPFSREAFFDLLAAYNGALWPAAVAYHIVFFTRINPAAWLLAAIFLLQAALFFWLGVIGGHLTFMPSQTVWTNIGWFLVVYALLYPAHDCGPPFFRVYDLRSTIDVRDAPERRRRGRRMGDAASRQGDAKVFKKYSQMKLLMKREALQRLNRAANESAGVLGQAG